MSILKKDEMSRLNLATVLSIIILIAILIIGYLKNDILSDINRVQIKNDIPYNELITVLYDYDELKELEKKLEDEYDYNDINYTLRKFKVEVLRKTCYGYYIILKAKNDYKLFIFMNEDKEIGYWLLTDEFKSEKEFLNKIKINKTTISDIEEYDGNGINFLSSGSDRLHITKEGYIWLYYDFYEDETVKRITTYKDDDYLDEKNSCPFHILSIDKQ